MRNLLLITLFLFSTSFSMAVEAEHNYPFNGFQIIAGDKWQTEYWSEVVNFWCIDDDNIVLQLDFLRELEPGENIDRLQVQISQFLSGKISAIPMLDGEEDNTSEEGRISWAFDSKKQSRSKINGVDIVRYMVSGITIKESSGKHAQEIYTDATLIYSYFVIDHRLYELQMQIPSKKRNINKYVQEYDKVINSIKLL